MSRLAFLAAGIFWLSAAALVCAETPLYEQEPYDQVTLDVTQDPNILKIVPLPSRQPPARGRPVDKLVVHLLDEPDKEYTVTWR